MALYTDVSTGDNRNLASRLVPGTRLITNLTKAEEGISENYFDYMSGWNSRKDTTVTNYSWMFKRAPGFFDVVCYTSSVDPTVKHSLGVTPELAIVKSRDTVGNWMVDVVTVNKRGMLQSNTSFDTGLAYSPYTSTTFNDSDGLGGTKKIAFLFATLAGVSKVGSYTGNGSSQTINCGFTTGARFILIKRTDSTGDWYIWDTARGIVAANDPHLSLNTTAAEVTTADSIDPESTGFIVNQNTATNINVTSATYIFLAIA